MPMQIKKTKNIKLSTRMHKPKLDYTEYEFLVHLTKLFNIPKLHNIIPNPYIAIKNPVFQSKGLTVSINCKAENV